MADDRWFFFQGIYTGLRVARAIVARRAPPTVTLTEIDERIARTTALLNASSAGHDAGAIEYASWLPSPSDLELASWSIPAAGERR